MSFLDIENLYWDIKTIDLNSYKQYKKNYL